MSQFLAGRRRRGTELSYLDRTAQIMALDPPDVAQRDEIWRLLLKLPPRQRAAVVLRYYEDLPDDAIADCLGCSKTAASSLLARALANLRSEFEGLPDDNG